MVAISVIIPVYNVEKYLKKCLDSVIYQTFRNIEIICVNDGSSDNSLKILKDYAQKDSRIKVYSQENKGLSSARNLGMNYATGEYICFLDSDDYFVLTALEELFRIAKDKSTDLILYKLLNFEDKTMFVVSKRYHEMNFLKKTDDIFNYKNIKEYLFKIDVTSCTKFFKRDLLNDLEFYEGLIFEDNLFYVDYIFKAKRIYFYDKYLYHRRIRSNSITRSHGKNHMDIIEISNKIIEKTKFYGCYDEFKSQLFDFKMENIYLRFSNILPEFKNEFFYKIKDDFEEYKKNCNFVSDSDKCRNVYNNMLNADTIKEFELMMEIYEYECVFDQMEQSNQKLIGEINSLNDKLCKSNQINDEIMSSNSWKITAPFRSFNRFLNNKK